MQFSHHSVYIEGGLRLDSAGAGFPGESLSGFPGESLLLRCCGYQPKNLHWHYPQVFSPYWRLYYNFAPGQQIRSDGKIIALNPAQFVLIPENMMFHCETISNAASRHLYIHFNFQPGSSFFLAGPVAIRADPAGIGIVKALRKEVVKARIVETGHLSLSLLHWVFSRLGGVRGFSKSWPLPLRKVVDHIGTDLSSDLSNPTLARMAGMSLRAFVRSFAEHINITPQLCVRQARVREAARRLAGATATIDQIAESLGFSNRYYFTRVFRAQMGVSPARFRRLLLEKRS